MLITSTWKKPNISNGISQFHVVQTSVVSQQILEQTETELPLFFFGDRFPVVFAHLFRGAEPSWKAIDLQQKLIEGDPSICINKYIYIKHINICIYIYIYAFS